MITDKQDTIKTLKKMLKPGDTIYTITRHVSQSGMLRRISAYAIKNNKPVYLDGYIEHLDIAKRHNRKDGLVIKGCGMDMHFWLVYELWSVLFPKGFKLAKGQYGRNSDDSGFDKDGGYAFRKESL